MKSLRRRRTVLPTVVLLGGVLAGRAVRAQQPAPPPPPAPSEPTTAPAESATSPAPGHSRIPQGFLIRGTVFDHQALSLAGAELHIRRSGEKKFHWQTYSNSRGEFAVRVPPGNEYEVVVQAKGFTDAVQPVNAKNGLEEESLVIHMTQASGKKK
jgi:carboxypeptidase family protein